MEKRREEEIGREGERGQKSFLLEADPTAGAPALLSDDRFNSQPARVAHRSLGKW